MLFLPIGMMVGSINTSTQRQSLEMVTGAQPSESLGGVGMPSMGEIV